MLAAAAVLPDADLPGLARRAAAVMAAQFARQEERFARLGCPCLADHRAIHGALLDAARAVAGAADDLPPHLLRPALAQRLAGLLDVHFSGADRQAVRCVGRPA
jgi:hemerythrin